MSTTTHTQHTPGPWKSEPWSVIGPTGYVVADINPLHDEYAKPLSSKAHEMALIGAANARLIAAAPDLLHHLRILAAEDSQVASDWVAKKVAARAAISKAEGATRFTPATESALARACNALAAAETR